MKKEVVKGRRGLSGCIRTHCLKSVRLVPIWTDSWAREPLYCTTLTLDSLPANWKKKVLLGELVFWFVCYVYALVLSSVNISASHPSWLITSELEEESHWRDIKASSQTQDNISHSHFLFWEVFFFWGNHFPAVCKMFFGILNKHHKPQGRCGHQRLGAEGYYKIHFLYISVYKSWGSQTRALPSLAGLWTVYLWLWW